MIEGIKGLWRLFEIAKDPVLGTLTHGSGEDDAKLHIEIPFAQFLVAKAFSSQLSCPQVIHGEEDGGRAITLLGCNLAKWRVVGSLGIFDIHALVVLRGASIKSWDDARFVYWKDYVSAAKKQHALAALTARYFPFLWDRSSGYVALDTDPDSGNRVVLLQTSPVKDPHPARQAYDSFEEFLKDAILANETNELLACLKNPKEPVDVPPAPQAAVNTAGVAGANSAHEKTIVLRTDFSNEAAWRSIRATLQNLYKGFDNTLDFMDNRAHDGLPTEKISSVFSDSCPSFVFVIDSTTLTKTDHPILVISFQNEPTQTFRVIPSALKDVENNLSTANMDFSEFANAVDKDGIFRGFRQT